VVVLRAACCVLRFGGWGWGWGEGVVWVVRRGWGLRSGLEVGAGSASPSNGGQQS